MMFIIFNDIKSDYERVGVPDSTLGSLRNSAFRSSEWMSPIGG